MSVALKCQPRKWPRNCSFWQNTFVWIFAGV